MKSFSLGVAAASLLLNAARTFVSGASAAARPMQVTFIGNSNSIAEFGRSHTFEIVCARIGGSSAGNGPVRIPIAIDIMTEARATRCSLSIFPPKPIIRLSIRKTYDE